MKRVISYFLAAAMIFSLATASGCKKKPTDDGSDYTESWIEEVSEIQEDGEQSQGAQTSGGKTPGKTNSQSGGNGGSTAGKKDTSVRNLGGRTITLVAYWQERVKGADQQANSYWKQKEAVEKKFNCKIKHVYKTRDAIDTEVISSILSGKPIADVFWTTYDRALSLIKGNMLYPVSDLKQFDFSESKWGRDDGTSTFNGKRYNCGISGGAVNAMLLYNKDYFEKNGLPDLFKLQQSGELSWNKLREIAKNATKGDVKGFAMANTPYNMAATFVQSNGGVFVSRDGDGFDFSCTLNSANTLYALQFWQDMYSKDKSCVEMLNFEYCINQFAAGKAAMHYSESYTWPEITKKAKFNIGAVAFPDGPNAKNKYGTTGGGACAVIPISAKNVEDIAMVWDAFADADKLDWENYYFDLFYNNDVITSIKQVVNYKGTKQADYVAGIGDFEEMGINKALSAVSLGETTPSQAVESLQGILKSKIASFQK